MAHRRPPPSVAVESRRRRRRTVSDVSIDGRVQHLRDDIGGCGWEEFTAARARFFAGLAVQSAEWAAERRLPVASGREYDRAAVDHGDESRSP